MHDNIFIPRHVNVLGFDLSATIMTTFLPTQMYLDSFAVSLLLYVKCITIVNVMSYQVNFISSSIV